MKKRNLLVCVMASCFLSCFLLSGCNGQKQSDTYTTKQMVVEEEAHLQNDASAPACKISIDYNYPDPAEENDTLTQRINHTVQSQLFGGEYADLAPQAAVDSFKNAYISNYRKEMEGFYREDLKNGTPKEELPSWYNYEYMLTTHFEDGKEGVLCFTSTTSEYTGGAHPNTWGKWMNFDKASGKQLTLEDVFMDGAEAPLKQLLTEALIAEASERMEDSTLQSLDDLRNAGILIAADMYVTDNFLLEKDKVSFLYNQYDIAPYSMGQFILSIPYAAIEKYMK